MNKTINDIRLVQTCGACPEQYDAFIGDKQVGYLRLRHGFFRVDYPECGGKTIYGAHPQGDGIFESDERAKYLEAAKEAILREYNLENGEPQPSNVAIKQDKNFTIRLKAAIEQRLRATGVIDHMILQPHEHSSREKKQLWAFIESLETITLESLQGVIN